MGSASRRPACASPNTIGPMDQMGPDSEELIRASHRGEDQLAKVVSVSMGDRAEGNSENWANADSWRDWDENEREWRRLPNTSGTQVLLHKIPKHGYALVTASGHRLAGVRLNSQLRVRSIEASLGGGQRRFERRSSGPVWRRNREMVLVDAATREPVLREDISAKFGRVGQITVVGGATYRFGMRGTKPGNSVMSAIDDSGTCHALYRFSDPALTVRTLHNNPSDLRKVQIVIPSPVEVDTRLTLVVAMTAHWIDLFFRQPMGGG